jgi:hypothetical protein
LPLKFQPAALQHGGLRARVLLDVGAGEGEVTEKLRDGGGFTAVVGPLYKLTPPDP